MSLGPSASLSLHPSLNWHRGMQWGEELPPSIRQSEVVGVRTSSWYPTPFPSPTGVTGTQQGMSLPPDWSQQDSMHQCHTSSRWVSVGLKRTPSMHTHLALMLNFNRRIACFKKKFNWIHIFIIPKMCRIQK